MWYSANFLTVLEFLRVLKGKKRWDKKIKAVKSMTAFSRITGILKKNCV